METTLKIKSKDHYCFINKSEYLLINDIIWQVPIQRPIMSDGNRAGIKWESPKWCFDKYRFTYK
jgi:hypothetical protein